MFQRGRNCCTARRKISRVVRSDYSSTQNSGKRGVLCSFLFSGPRFLSPAPPPLVVAGKHVRVVPQRLRWLATMGAVPLRMVACYQHFSLDRVHVQWREGKNNVAGNLSRVLSDTSVRRKSGHGSSQRKENAAEGVEHTTVSHSVLHFRVFVFVASATSYRPPLLNANDDSLLENAVRSISTVFFHRSDSYAKMEKWSATSYRPPLLR